MSTDSNILANFGISASLINIFPNNISVIKKATFKKVSSANEVLSLSPADFSKKQMCYETEDKSLYQSEDTTSEVHELVPQVQNEQLFHLEQIIRNLNCDSNQTRQVIKAYRSKMKTKFFKIYENNSISYKEKMKYKIFHKCCYPHCGRTFSSSGWLKAHFEEHLKKMMNNRFNVLFEKVINDEGALHEKLI